MRLLRFMSLLFTVKLTVYLICSFKETDCHHIFHNTTANSSSDILIGLLGVAENAVHTAREYSNFKARSENVSPNSNSIDCAEILEKNSSSKSGVYQVWPRSRAVQGPANVYCDMEDDGGAWTVLQRRGDFDSAKDYFYRDWKEYKNGFGDPLRDFWIGNDIIFALTNERANSLKFYLSDWEGNITYAAYDDFWMDDENQDFTIHVAGYRGTAGDSFTYANDAPFTTKDRDNDKHAENCAVMFKGAWWYTSCHNSNLNGQYLKGAHESYADGVEWSAFRGLHYSLKDTVMKIRPKDFPKKEKLDVTPQ